MWTSHSFTILLCCDTHCMYVCIMMPTYSFLIKLNSPKHLKIILQPLSKKPTQSINMSLRKHLTLCENICKYLIKHKSLHHCVTILPGLFVSKSNLSILFVLQRKTSHWSEIGNFIKKYTLNGQRHYLWRIKFKTQQNRKLKEGGKSCLFCFGAFTTIIKEYNFREEAPVLIVGLDSRAGVCWCFFIVVLLQSWITSKSWAPGFKSRQGREFFSENNLFMCFER